MDESQIFGNALKLPTPLDRVVYLDMACGGKPELRSAVEALLKAHGGSSQFLEHPAGCVSELPIPPSTGTETESHCAWREVTQRLPAPSDSIGAYRLIQKLGEGGMGVVYLAEQSHPVRRQVAIKLIKAGMDSRSVVARFEAEKHAIALMDHPNIARVLDAGAADDGRPYFVMELVQGVPIAHYCDERRLTLRQRLELFVPVCHAVQHAHQKGIIHRDIKPSNVLICQYDGKAVAKVIDFGVAKATGQKLTESTVHTGLGLVVGTLQYMSPEQAELGKLDVDTRSDVYSLGVLLFELLTGSTPLDHKRLNGTSFVEVLKLIREEETPRPSARLSTIDDLAVIASSRGLEQRKLAGLIRGELDWIVMKALEKDRNRRYESSGALAQDIERYLAGDAVQACPPSALYRSRKFFQRHQKALAFAGLILFVIALLGGGGGWVVRDRMAREYERKTREAALDHQVDQILNEASSLIENAHWADGAAAVQRTAQLLLAAGRDEKPSRLLELQHELECAEKLEGIYSRPKTEEFFQGQELDDAYEETFSNEGIIVSALSISEAAERIRTRSIRRELARALDFWAYVRMRSGSKKQPDWKQLTEIAEAADSDPWRNKLREARRRGDYRVLESLAASADVARFPPDTVLLLANALYECGGNRQAMALIKRGNWQYPDDWWLANLLGWWCLVAHPPMYDEAVRYYGASIVSRPRNPYAFHALGQAFQGKGAHEDAVAAFSRAIELKPDYRTARSSRAKSYLALDRVALAMADLDGLKRPADFQVNPGAAKHFFKLLPADRVIAEAHDDIRLGRNVENAYFRLAVAFERKGAWADAVAAYTAAGRLYPNNGDMIGRLAWLLATCPDARIQDSARALARGRNGPSSSTSRSQSLARTGRRDLPCRELAHKPRVAQSIHRAQPGRGRRRVVLSCHGAFQARERGDCADWYEQAVRWLAKSKPVDETSLRARELARFRAEAETLLGIKK